MNVGDLLTRLSIGPLSNLSMSNEGDGTIIESKQAKLIQSANDGLLQIYSRFIIAEKNIVIQMIDGITNYYLLKRFAQSNCEPGEPIGPDPIYIMDALEPFEQDVIKILTVYDHLGREQTLNDKGYKHSLFTPKFNQLQVPRPIEGMPLSVVYQARHRKLEPGVMEADITVPEVLQEALVAYIASKVYSGMNGQENIATGQTYMNEFEGHCALITDRDLVNNTPATTSEIFTLNGWI